jgi:hypothetical protein
MDRFDEFLQTFGNADLQVLLNNFPADVPRPGSRRPRSPTTLPPRRSTRARLTDVADQLDDNATEPPSPFEIPSSTVRAATTESPVTDETASRLHDLTLSARVSECERKIHNASRGGRNKLYYEILAKYGHEKAKAFYIPATTPLTPAAVNPPPKAVSGMHSQRPAPPPPPPAGSASSSNSVPWRSQNQPMPPPPIVKQYNVHR